MEEIKGYVEHIVYRNEENGYTVFNLNNEYGELTCVGKFHYIEEEKLFFKAAFRNDDQNCLRDHDFQLILRFYENQIQEKTKQPIPENLHFQLEMYCQGSVYMTTQWVLGDMKKRPEEMARNLVAAMPAELETLFKKLELL